MRVLANLKTYIIAAALSGLLTFTYACNTSTVVTYLNAVIAAADTAVAGLEVAGQIPAPIGTLITNYLATVSTAASESAIELQSSDTTAVKVQKITTYFATSILPTFTNIPPSIIASIQAVDAAVKVFLSSIGAGQPGLASARALPSTIPAHIPINRTDRTTLKEISVEGLQLAVRAEALRK
jgi:hypothetical protein